MEIASAQTLTLVGQKSWTPNSFCFLSKNCADLHEIFFCNNYIWLSGNTTLKIGIPEGG
jgi:hypothetical protein